MKSFIWVLLIAAGVTFASIHPILINLAKDKEGRIQFSSASVALNVELCKLFISLVMVIRNLLVNHNHATSHLNLWVVILYAVPALLYTVVNNLVTHAQAFMDPSSFQIMNNLKIVSTALFYRLIISSHVSTRRWFAVVLLFVGGVVNSVGGLQHKENRHDSKEVFITLNGIYIMCVYCAVSGLAGVYTEAVLKKYKQISIHLLNTVLYGFGVMINGFLFISQKTYNKIPEETGFFEGHNAYTWLIVITQALNGIIISLIMKHLSNLTRLLMIGVSMILTTLLSYVIFSLSLDGYFMCAFLVVMIALYLYYERPSQDAMSMGKRI